MRRIANPSRERSWGLVLLFIVSKSASLEVTLPRRFRHTKNATSWSKLVILRQRPFKIAPEPSHAGRTCECVNAPGCAGAGRGAGSGGTCPCAGPALAQCTGEPAAFAGAGRGWCPALGAAGAPDSQRGCQGPRGMSAAAGCRLRERSAPSMATPVLILMMPIDNTGL